MGASGSKEGGERTSGLKAALASIDRKSRKYLQSSHQLDSATSSQQSSMSVPSSGHSCTSSTEMPFSGIPAAAQDSATAAPAGAAAAAGIYGTSPPHQHMLSPRPPNGRSSADSLAGKGKPPRPSGSLDIAAAQQQQQQQLMLQKSRLSFDKGSTCSSPSTAKAASLLEIGLPGTAASITGFAVSGSQGGSRASFSRDADADYNQHMITLPGYDSSASGLSKQASSGSGQQLLLQSAQHKDSKTARGSVDSCASRGSSHSGARSSFAAEAELEGAASVEMDQYGRPSFAAFEPIGNVLTGKGAIFEASLPSDLVESYQMLAALMPQAPIPLVTVLQLWDCTDPQEAQEMVQIFVMQGVLKVATLPDGATWVMVSPEHQQYLQVVHPTKVGTWHRVVLSIYKKQVLATRYLQQQQQLGRIVPRQSLSEDDVTPDQFVNDGYIWLALTHHLLGAGEMDQIRQVLINPAWLELKLHCYGVAPVVDDFRNYLQVKNDLLVKAVLQAFQMSLPCCMERSHLPMMQHQLVLRLMAAARAAVAVAAAPVGTTALSHDSDHNPAGSVRSKSSSDTGSPPAAAAAAAQIRGVSIGSGGSGIVSQQQEFEQEMQAWYEQQYQAARAGASLLYSGSSNQALQQQQQRLPPHLMGYRPSLNQAGGRHRMSLRGHLGPIRRVVITADGKDVLTASDDGSAQVWDMDIGDCVMQLRLPEQLLAAAAAASPSSLQSPGSGSERAAAVAGPPPLTTLVAALDGGCCLCGDAEGWLTCWNYKTGELVQRVKAHRARLNALAIDKSGSRCLTGGADRTVKLWSLPAAAPGMNHNISINAAGAAGYQDGPISGAGGGLIGSLQCNMEVVGHGLDHSDTGSVLDVAFSGDGTLGASASDDLHVRVWNLDSEGVTTCKGHTGWVVSVRFMGNSHTLVSASHDGTARVWDGRTGDCLAVLSGHQGRLNAARSSSDGHIIITCSDDHTARLWDTINYTCLGVFEGHTSWINDAALLRGGSQAVTVSGDSTARLWDTRTQECVQVLQGHSDDVTCLVLTSRGRFVVTGSVDGTAQVWDLAAQDVACVDVHDGKVIAVVAGPDGRRAASIGADGRLRLWELASGACLSNEPGHVAAMPLSLMLVQDGSRAFSAGGDGKLVAWDVETGVASICIPARQGSRTKYMHVSADGGTAVALLFDSSMAVYDTATGEIRCHLMKRGDRDAQRVHSGGVNAVYLTADGSKAVSVSKDHSARVWDAVNGRCLRVLEGHDDSIQAAVLSPDESLLATASFDGTVRMWHLASGDCLKVLQHTDPVMRVAFSSDSSRLVTSCDSRAMWLWDVQTGACIAALAEHKDTVTAMCFSPDGKWLASASQDRSVLVWQAVDGQLAGVYVGDASMLYCTFALRSCAIKLKPIVRRVDSDVIAATDGRYGAAKCTASQAAVPSSSTSADAVGSHGAPGLTLLAGDASGQVHFIDCM